MEGNSPWPSESQPGGLDWQALERSDDFQQLVSARRRYLQVMNIAWIGLFAGFMLLVAFGQGFLNISLVGAFTVGFLVVVLANVLTFTLVAIYSWKSNRRFVPMEQRARRSFERRGDAHGAPSGEEPHDER